MCVQRRTDASPWDRRRHEAPVRFQGSTVGHAGAFAARVDHDVVAAWFDDHPQCRQGGRRLVGIMACLRDIIRAAFRLTGWANTASARRAHATPTAALTLHGIP
jgi:hypothetical protein